MPKLTPDETQIVLDAVKDILNRDGVLIDEITNTTVVYSETTRGTIHINWRLPGTGLLPQRPGPTPMDSDG